MINWFNIPDEGLSNGGQFEVKNLEVTENGTYEEKGEMYNKVTVNVEGGGSSWQTVFEGSVTTESESTFATGDIVGLESLNGDSVKVTFNGAEYTLPKHELGYGEMGNGNIPDFTNYPLFIETTDTPYLLYTQTAGTYTLKIEEPQSGGSSDFSTAEVEFKNQTTTPLTIPCCCIIGNNIQVPPFPLGAAKNKTFTAVLYKGSQQVEIPFGVELTTVTGDITLDSEEGIITINGSGTVLFQP